MTARPAGPHRVRPGCSSRPEPHSGRSRARFSGLLSTFALLLATLGLFPAAPLQAQQTPPAQISDLTVYHVTGGFDLTWTAPSSSAAITGYDAHYRLVGDPCVIGDNVPASGSNNPCGNWVVSSRTPGDTSTLHVVTGLDHRKAYKLRVRAKNAHGDAPWVFSASVNPLPGTPSGTVLVSTLGRPRATNVWSTNGYVTAQGFTTGSAANGYTLAGIEINTSDSTPTTQQRAAVRAELWSAATSGGPDSRLASLMVPSSVPANSIVSFAAPSNTHLAASTTYFFVIYTTDTTNLAFTTTASDAEDPDAETGWSVGDTNWYVTGQQPSAGSWVEETTSGSDLTMRLRVSGTVQSSNADLSGLAASTAPNSEGTFTTLTLAPAFSAAMTSYTATVENTRTHAKLRPTVADATATVTVQGSLVPSGTDSGEIALAVGANAITVRVTAQDSTTKDYTVTITRQAQGVTPAGDDGQAELPPEPLQLALWTDRPGYLAGETVRLYHTLDPHDDDGRYRVFAWLEPAEGQGRRYLAPLSADGALHSSAVDIHGQPEHAARALSLPRADKALAWDGESLAPGRWRFVLELRPGSAAEQPAEPRVPLGTRRAWAAFTVAERGQLLNRRGFDRELRSDLTLRSDTLYFMGHQLFVRDGATLTIEAGTVVRAFGPHTAIIVEPGGRIVAEGTRQAPVVLTCSAPAGRRQPGCWGGLRILGQAPVTRLEGVAPGVLPAERAAYGGTEAEGSSGRLRYLRVEFAGATGDPESPGPAIGLYGAGSGTVLDHVQTRHSLGDGFAFSGGTAACGHCVASGSGAAGLAWQRGWQGAADHLFVLHGPGGTDGLAGAGDVQGHDREPRSMPTLSNLTLVHASPYGRHERKGAGLRLSAGSAVIAQDLLVTRFGGGAIDARARSALLFREGESSLRSALLRFNGPPQLRGLTRDAVDFSGQDPRLRDVRFFANPDPRPKPASFALPDEGEAYIGAFGQHDNWLEQWTVFGAESDYDPRNSGDAEDSP